MSAPIQFWFDYASPWSYFANKLLPERFPGASISYHPMYLRGLPMFKNGVPYDMTKSKYLYTDLHRAAAFHRIPFKFSSTFPINGVHALRGALWTQQHGGFADYHRAMFDAAWAQDRNIADKATVIAIAGELGLDVPAFTAGIDDPTLKERLRAQTEAALERGTFGAPTFFVGDEMFWGHDRMDYVARAAGVA